MGLIITIIVAIVILCIVHETLPRVFDAFFSGIGVGVDLGSSFDYCHWRGHCWLYRLWHEVHGDLING